MNKKLLLLLPLVPLSTLGIVDLVDRALTAPTTVECRQAPRVSPPTTPLSDAPA